MTFDWKGARWVWALSALALAGCNQSPEDFCKSKVEQVCQVAAGCCSSSAKFDDTACAVQASEGCEKTFQVEKVHAGDVVFDSGAADTCYGSIETCDDLQGKTQPTLDRIKACNNVLTGYRPAGAGCEDSTQCKKDGGDYPTCYGFNGNKLCAKAVLSDDACSFSLDTLELHVCGPDKYCDIPTKTPDAGQPPTKQGLEFSGTCKPYPGQGEKCAMTGQQACADGLYCKGGACEAQKGMGEACMGFGDECKDGLQCQPNGGMGGVCTSLETDGPYCYKPPVCGDGFCDAPLEDPQSCSKDCGKGGNNCGDGVCDPEETPETCPLDCAKP
jgi:hypothetical protein